MTDLFNCKVHKTHQVAFCPRCVQAEQVALCDKILRKLEKEKVRKVSYSSTYNIPYMTGISRCLDVVREIRKEKEK